MSIWLKGLNPEQKEAVKHTKGPLLILAGAGSGKTTVLVSRTGRLIDEEGIAPQKICVLTFTNKAAREIKERVAAKVGASAKGIWSGTFHSFGLKFLKRNHKFAGLPKSFGVMDSSDSSAIVKEIIKNLNIDGKADFDADRILNKINDWRGRGQTKARVDDPYDYAAEVVLPKYLEKMQLMGVVDFESLLIRPLEIFEKHPQVLTELQDHFEHLMVDEFQDTNGLQMKLVRALGGGSHNITVVGDDDQAIYGWRGAEVKNILNFPKSYSKQGCQTIRLERNYRSAPAILNLANEIISRNSERHHKVLKPNGEELGEIPELFVFESEDEEVERSLEEIERLRSSNSLDYKDFAILYRSNGQGALFEGYLRKNNIPYTITGGTAFFDRKEAKDILAYLRCCIRPNEVALRRIINLPARGIGGVTIKAFEEYAAANDVSFFKAVCRWRDCEVDEKTGEKIDDFLRILKGLSDRIMNENDHRSPGTILLDILEEIGYKRLLEKTSKDSLTFQKRMGFVEIFTRVLDSFASRGGKNEKTLRDFVDALELRDTAGEEDEKDALQLMTLHASKGLEFPVVFLVGLEEDILPHRTLGSDISEERRLFYVGVTRAKQRLILSRAQARRRYGKLRPSAPSRFLLEVSESLMRTYQRGLRPIEEGKTKSAFSDFFNKLDSKIEKQRL